MLSISLTSEKERTQESIFTKKNKASNSNTNSTQRSRLKITNFRLQHINSEIISSEGIAQINSLETPGKNTASYRNSKQL